MKTQFILKKKTRKTIFYCAMVALPVLQFIIFYICVNINSISLAFQSITKEVSSDGRLYYSQTFTVETLKSVVQAVFGENMGQVWKNTFVAYFFSSWVGALFALLFSYYIFKKFTGSGLFKVVLFLPQVVSGLVLIVMYRYFVVDVLSTLFPGIPDLLDASNQNSFYTLLVFNIWTGFGTTIMMYIGGMNNISESILEYAKLDGVTPLQEFIYIIMPMVYPTFTTFVVVGLSGIFTNQMRLFDFYGNNAELYLQTLGYRLYAGVNKAGSDLTEYPHYAAMGILFTCMTVPVTLTVRWAMQKFGPKVE